MMSAMGSPDPSDAVLIQAAADLHGELPEIEPCDLLLLVGDLVPPALEHDSEASRDWLAFEFAQWLEEVPAEEVIAVAGNHDFWATDVRAGEHAGLFGARWTYLRDAQTTAAGLRIYGSPWTPDVYGAAFEAPEAQLARIWAAIPTELDVLMVHCPPRGHGDQIANGDAAPTLMGSTALTRAVARTHPRLVIFGHAHEAYGYRAEDPAGTLLANVSVRTDYLGGLAEPSAFELLPR